MRHREKKFTLIELLTVIAVILILVALLMPTLSRVKRTAMKVVCMNQLKQTMIAQTMNAGDHDGKIAAHGNWGQPTIWKKGFVWWGPEWQDQLWTGMGMLHIREYITEPKLMWCPANLSPNLAFDHSSWGYRENPMTTGAHWMANSYVDRQNIYKLTDGDDPSGTALHADLFTYHTFYFPGGPLGVEFHHQDGYNVAYLDGSCEFYKDPGKNIAMRKVWGVAQELVVWAELDR